MSDEIDRLTYTPVKARRGGKTHASYPEGSGATACGRRPSGWAVALGVADCVACLRAIAERGK